MKQKGLGDYIRGKRSEIGLSLRALARQVKVTPGFLSDVELGRRLPSEKVLSRIALTLQVSVDDFAQYDHRKVLVQVRDRLRRDPSFCTILREALQSTEKERS
jgi:transcriptional regulator with XRE-family HTH domain